MGRNTTGGNKQKRGKNSTQESKKRPLTYADNKETLYGLVISPLGDCAFLVHCNDNQERIGYIRGAMYKSCFIQSGDMTLVSLREFEQVKLGRKERCDVILKYHAEEVTQLVKRGLYYKDSVRPFLTKLEKGKSTKFDHQSDTGGGGGGDDDDDIITVVTDAKKDVKRLKERGLQESGLQESGLKESGLQERGLKENGLQESGLKERGLQEEDDSEFLLAKEDINDFYGNQEDEREKQKGGAKVKDIGAEGGGKEKKEESEDGEDEDEDGNEKFDCFGNSLK